MEKQELMIGFNLWYGLNTRVEAATKFLKPILLLPLSRLTIFKIANPLPLLRYSFYKELFKIYFEMTQRKVFTPPPPPSLQA